MASVRQNGSKPGNGMKSPQKARGKLPQRLNHVSSDVPTLMNGIRLLRDHQSLAFFLSLLLVEEIVDIGLHLFKAALFGLAADLGRVSPINSGTGSKSLSEGMIFLDFMISIDVAADFTLGH